MAKYNKGYEKVKVTLLNWPGNDFAKKVYEFGRLSHDYIEGLPEKYDEHNPECIKLINKIIEGKTLPKYALTACRFDFRIENISRVCLAQLTRDNAIFASQSTGVFPLSQEFNIPLSVYRENDVMELVDKAQHLLEEAYIRLCERDIPTMEARYIGLHSQVISLTASYTPSDFVRSCFSRTSSNFCDECNLVYRLMYREVVENIRSTSDSLSRNLYKWIFNEKKCINDGYYERERLYNSDFTTMYYEPILPALNDWRKSGWKEELENMLKNNTGYLTDFEKVHINAWITKEKCEGELPTTFDKTRHDVARNAIKNTNYYEEYRNE